MEHVWKILHANIQESIASCIWIEEDGVLNEEEAIIFRNWRFGQCYHHATKATSQNKSQIKQKWDPPSRRIN
jgi:hypothetical protein